MNVMNLGRVVVAQVQTGRGTHNVSAQVGGSCRSVGFRYLNLLDLPTLRNVLWTSWDETTKRYVMRRHQNGTCNQVEADGCLLHQSEIRSVTQGAESREKRREGKQCEREQSQTAMYKNGGGRGGRLRLSRGKQGERKMDDGAVSGPLTLMAMCLWIEESEAMQCSGSVGGMNGRREGEYLESRCSGRAVRLDVQWVLRPVRCCWGLFGEAFKMEQFLRGEHSLGVTLEGLDGERKRERGDWMGPRSGSEAGSELQSAVIPADRWCVFPRLSLGLL
ncbi:hypothetical protein LZ32DRAFT_216143 [Colletotrichum eremochloae]|nr:hypothetical protein LZ32DRAFT_216143 [Colletotrichum eremochloae]